MLIRRGFARSESFELSIVSRGSLFSLKADATYDLSEMDDFDYGIKFVLKHIHPPTLHSDSAEISKIFRP